jgi:integrase
MEPEAKLKPEPKPKAPRPRGTGCVYRQAGSAFWWISYSHRGKRHQESSGFTDKRKAEKKLDLRLAQLRTGTFVGLETERIKIDVLADDVLRDYRVNGKRTLAEATSRWELHLKPFFGGMRAAEITSTDINRYTDQRQQEGAKNATINRELALLKRAFYYGLEENSPPKVKSVPCIHMLDENNVRTGFFEWAEFKRVLDYSPELWWRAVLMTAYTYGWRNYSELYSMKVSQVDLVSRTLRLEPGTTKNKEGREVRMTPDVFTLLAACVAGKNPTDHVFTRNGKPVRNCKGMWKSACIAAGCPGRLMHDMRRTASRNLINAGVSEKTAMRITGHKTRTVFDRYCITSKNDLDNAVLKLTEAQTLTQQPNVYSSAIPAPELQQPAALVASQGNA